MAIFGDLSDLPFPEIFNMVGRRTGSLEIFGVPGLPRFELSLIDGDLCCLQVGPEVVDDPLQVRDKLAVLMDAHSGTFEFQRRAAESLRSSFRLSIPSLLMAIASAVDEISAYRERFAHPKTRFRIMGTDEVWLDEDLWEFLERATPLLLLGADAEELSASLHVSLGQVQLHLYKLRSVGRVAPVRAFEEEPPPPQPQPALPAPAVEAAPPPLTLGLIDQGASWGLGGVTRLLRALRTRLGASRTA